MVDLVDTDRGEADRGGDFVPEDGGRGVADVGVDELAGDDAVAEEGLAVGEVGVGHTGVGGGIVPAYRDELFIGGQESGTSYQPPSVSFCLANSSSLPGSTQGDQRIMHSDGFKGVRLTSVEWRYLAGVVRLPEKLSLIQGILRGTPVLDVGVLRV